MNGHAIARSSLSYEENVSLLDEKSLSDIDSDAGRAENESRFPVARDWAKYGHRLVSRVSVPRKLPSKSACRSLAIRAALFLLPSFVSSRLSHHDRPRGGDRLGPTAYLDGMRGLAAFIVFFCHYFYTSFDIANGYGASDEHWEVMKLPFLRLYAAGPPMVAVFFIVSGYALSLKPLKLARGQKWSEFANTMSSFVFRRAIRLFLPTAISTFIIFLLLRSGAYEWNREWSHDRTYHWNVQETAAPLMETSYEQFMDWAWAMFNFVHVWGWEKYGGSTYYDVHLWTIPIEFRASMFIFLTLIGLGRLRTGLRFLFLAVVMAFSYRSDRWEMVLFYFGMLYAELDIIRGAHTDPSTTATPAPPPPAGLPTTEPKPIEYVGTGHHGAGTSSAAAAAAVKGKLSRAFWALLSVGALFLLSQPDANSDTTPGWVYLSSLIPEWVDDKYRYWQCAGAALFVFCVARMPGWQRFFNTPVIQYLGKISYAIYLMHGPVLHTVGYSFERWAWGLTGVEGANFTLGFLLAALFVVPAVVWAADVFWRAVDAPVVRFAKWLETRCVARPDGPQHSYQGRSSSSSSSS